MKNLKKYLTLFALGLAGGVMYIYPYIRYVFQNPLNETLGISDTQAGLLLTVYGVVSIILYIPGGILADKLRAKKPMLISMGWALVLLIGFAIVLGLHLRDKTPYWIALGVWGLMPIATTFVFWSSLVKAIRLTGGEDDQGRCFGIYFAANAIFSMVVSSSNMFIYTQFSAEGNGIMGVTISVAFFIGVAMLAITILFKEKNLQMPKSDESYKREDIKAVLKNGTIWIAGITIMLVYIIFTLTTYFTTYMTAVCGMSDEISGVLTIFRTYFIMIFAAIFSGMIADKIFHSTLKWYRVAAICMAASTAIFILVGFSDTRAIFGIPNNIVLIAAISILPGIFSTMIYAVQWAILSEINLPAKVAGTATGLASMIVFSPDIWLNTGIGAILDATTQNPEAGYLFIFGILIAVSLAVFLLCHYLLKRSK